MASSTEEDAARQMASCIWELRRLGLTTLSAHGLEIDSQTLHVSFRTSSHFHTHFIYFRDFLAPLSGNTFCLAAFDNVPNRGDQMDSLNV